MDLEIQANFQKSVFKAKQNFSKVEIMKFEWLRVGFKSWSKKEKCS
jgi:hypothetical protein